MNKVMSQRIAAFTASVMGNPEYHKSTKDVVQAKDDRMVGIERVNEYQSAHHEKRVVKQMKPWAAEDQVHA